jgi:hypothetical protein
MTDKSIFFGIFISYVILGGLVDDGVDYWSYY